MDIILTVEQFHDIYFLTEPVNLNLRFLLTEKFTEVRFITEAVEQNIRFFLTEYFNSVYFITEESLFIEEDELFPTWLEEYRQQATDLMYLEISNALKQAFSQEELGKKDTCNYDLGLHFNALIDYLSIISRNMREDETSSIEREDGYLYYYDLYKIDQMIINFKKKGINIKPLLTIFHIDSYIPVTYDYSIFNV